ncbi:MAG: hypothetical protein QM702_16815 [Rubrivivax sp.]
MPAQYIPYHSSALFDRAEKAAKLLQGVEAAILCVATAEAFLHDLTEWLSIAVKHKEDCPQRKRRDGYFHRGPFEVCATPLHQITEEEISLCCVLREAESRKAAICAKYILAAEHIKPGKWKKGGRPLQPFISLVRIRNDIIHIKGNTLSEKNGKIVGYPKSIHRLILERVIPEPNCYTNWLNLIDAETFCSFSIETVKNLIESFHGILPETYMSQRFVKSTRLA